MTEGNDGTAHRRPSWRKGDRKVTARMIHTGLSERQRAAYDARKKSKRDRIAEIAKALVAGDPPLWPSYEAISERDPSLPISTIRSHADVLDPHRAAFVARAGETRASRAWAKAKAAKVGEAEGTPEDAHGAARASTKPDVPPEALALIARLRDDLERCRAGRTELRAKLAVANETVERLERELDRLKKPD